MDNFEMFLQLDDLKGVAADNAANMLEEYRANKPEIITNEAWEESSIEDESPEPGKWDFLEEGDDFKFEDEEESQDDSESENMEDAPTTPDSESEEGYEEYPESYDVDFETVITLPNGEDMTIEQLSKGYFDGEAIKQREAQLAEREARLEEARNGATTLLDYSEMECDRVIADYKDFDWDWLADNDPIAYRDNKRFLEKYQNRKQEIINLVQQKEAEKQAREDEVFRAKSVACVQVLKHRIPEGWNDALYDRIADYAIGELGADEDKFLQINDPSIIEAFYKARKWDHAEDARIKAKIKGAPKRHLKSGGTPMKNAVKMQQERAAEAYAKGQMSQADAFKFLED